MIGARTCTIAGGLVFYNAYEELKRCLPTLARFDRVFCIDGRYAGFDGETALSNDGSRELVQSFSNTVLLDAPDLPEFQKRQIYFNICDCDYLLIIDSDEWLEGDLTTFFWWLNNKTTPTKLLYRVPVADHEKKDWFRFMPRLALHPRELEYRRAHYLIAKKSDAIGKYVNHERSGWAYGIRIMHDHTLRKKEYLQKREQYQKELKAFESKIIPQTLETEGEAILKVKRELGRT